MKLSCTCDEWKQGWAEIGCAVLMWATKMGEWNTRVFEFCPWCGAKLKTEE